QRACPSATAPPVRLCAELVDEEPCRHLAPSLPRQAANACDPAPVAPTRLAPAQAPNAAALQSERDVAVVVRPGRPARAAPAVRVRHPVPTHSAVVSTSPSAANPPVAAEQAPAA